MADDTEQGTGSAGIPPAVRAVYGPEDLSAVPSFAGGFINFGHWDGIPLDGPLGTEERVRSEQNLYRRVLEHLGATERKSAAEIGCGLGLGCALALREFGLAEATGVDLHPAQLERARRANADLLAASPPRLHFVLGSAERLPFAGGAFDLLYSVEAAQHFRDLGAFAREAARVLRPGGRMAVASFFTPRGGAGEAEELAARLEGFATGLDVAHPLPGLLGALERAGLAGVRAESIGASVWPGLDRFLAGIDLPVQWPRNFLGAYRDGLLDYYTVTAERPAAG
ncbi:class I SAM-dependent methyltransferase [Nocardiopsis potens]|uniref:class I SAM-dependent methyltransferase n=1 Tax=Nocardiopsis potens TaxID=1246458 RepID=UPI00034587F3|nr:class I SAM-dependent methyltransferase [Nocardiopsis potens]